ncbi:uncharacterized protein LOC107487315 [Arachis duranensis]|uniref:Large ribosomal subunit protein mL53 n=2 Tax=Arachis duranensis TaxID=130453 RepID=A0A6P4D742_ARADU|nr:uncharacterized protein LOC107487315 [Arachis duranensis]
MRGGSESWRVRGRVQDNPAPTRPGVHIYIYNFLAIRVSRLRFSPTVTELPVSHSPSPNPRCLFHASFKVQAACRSSSAPPLSPTFSALPPASKSRTRRATPVPPLHRNRASSGSSSAPPLSPTCSCMEFMAQCNSRKARESNPACQVEVKRRTDEHPPQITVTFVNGVEQAFDATSTPAQIIRTMILEKGQTLETEQMFREAGESWPAIIPKEELSQPAPGVNPRKAEEKKQ